MSKKDCPKFFTKIKNKPTRVLELQDLEDIKKYQLSLIDFFIYETKRHDEHKRNKLIKEIREVEGFLKYEFKELTNDKNRKLIK